MAMQWLVNRFSSSCEDVPAEPEQDVRTFHGFSDLPTELRLQIWEHYFDVPRIHVLYRGSSESKRAYGDETPLAYADLTARTNHDIPTDLRFAAAAMNREALGVFRKTFDFVHVDFMSLPSKRVRELFDNSTGPDQRLSEPEDVVGSDPVLSRLVRNPDGRPRDMLIPGIHTNWGNDLLYLTDGIDVNCDMLRRACNGPIASKLRRVAILIHDGCTYEGWRRFYGPSVDFPKPSTTLAEVILVVRLRDLDVSTYATADRDEFGFAPYDSVVQGQKKGSWEWLQEMKMIERRFVYVAQLLREAFPGLEDHKIKWAVDIDYTHHKAETRYSRNIRQ
ncbi:hypothetical protein NUW58_g4868 [Xylaria curta]|uniref:Uncharacterized protein n=1 Tax=Xylaria curta TaxID=42375 RepID=A0ACC1P4I7_9PEZI|nr:hypothetical protein NUW58_g4868 [Xylaria curta]